MKKVLAVFVLLFVLGCQLGGTRDRESALRESYRSGTQGLEFRFVENLPPARLYDDQDLDVLVEVYNRGASDVGYANERIYLSGFDPNIITGISSFGQPIPTLGGKSLYNEQGDRDIVSFKGIIRNLGAKNIDYYDSTLLLTGCYSYETIVSANVCIDPDPFSVTAERKICVPSNVNIGSQGAPMAVSSVQLEPSPGRTRFRIIVTDVGGGTALKYGADVLARCNPYDARGLGFEDTNYVRLDQVEVSGVSILGSCRPLKNGHIRLSNGRGEVTCEYRAPRATPEYTTPLTIKLSYGYRQELTKPIRVIRTD